MVFGDRDVKVDVKGLQAVGLCRDISGKNGKEHGCYC